MVWASGYTAFGQSVGQSGSTNNHYGWGAGSGYRSDGFGPTYAAPLMKVGARYYDPEFGCFLTRDTVLSEKPYVYCDDDPINYTDPSGYSDLGYYFGFLAPALTIGIIVVFALVTGPIFIGSALGVVTLLAIGAIAGSAGDHMSDAIGEANKERDRRVQEDQEPKDRPEKAGGVSPGDASKTEAEGEGNGSIQGDTSAPNPTTYDDYDSNNNKIAGPYVGPPHYPVHDVPQ